LKDQGNYKEAAAAFKEAAQIDPDFTAAEVAAKEAKQIGEARTLNDNFILMMERLTAEEIDDNERIVRLEQIENQALREDMPRGGGEEGPTPGAGPNVEIRVQLPNVE
jgi:hypothetical protein